MKILKKEKKNFFFIFFLKQRKVSELVSGSRSPSCVFRAIKLGRGNLFKVAIASRLAGHRSAYGRF